MTHPFDGVTPEVVVEGITFTRKANAPWYSEPDDDLGLAIDVFLPGHGSRKSTWGRDYRAQGECKTYRDWSSETTSTPTFNLDLPEGFEAFRAHLRETRGGRA